MDVQDENLPIYPEGTEECIHCLGDGRYNNGMLTVNCPQCSGKGYTKMRKYKCEMCHDTGWYGDQGPGRKGNREYQRCECMAGTKSLMNENKASQLLKEFMNWYEETTGDNISSYDQDTTPYAVWEFLTHCDKRHLTRAMHSDGEGSAVFEESEYAIDYVDAETIRLTRRR